MLIYFHFMILSLLTSRSGGLYVRTLAGSGHGSDDGDVSVASFNSPNGVAVSGTGHKVYVADTANHLIRVISVSEDADVGGIATTQGAVTTLAGTNGVMGTSDSTKATSYTTATSADQADLLSHLYAPAQMSSPMGLALRTDSDDVERMLFVTDRDNHAIRHIDTVTGWVTTVVSADMKVDGLTLALPTAITLDSSGHLYIADTGNNRIVVCRIREMQGVVDVSRDYLDNRSRLRIYFKYAEGRLQRMSRPVVDTIPGPSGLALSATGSDLYVSDTFNHRILRMSVIDPGAGNNRITVLAGSSGEEGSEDGMGDTALFSYPCGLALSSDGTVLYVSDRNNHAIRAISTGDGEVTTMAGMRGEGDADGAADEASFRFPGAIAAARPSNGRSTVDGTLLYVMDTLNEKVRKLTDEYGK